MVFANKNDNTKYKHNDQQQIVTGVIKESKSGGEVITFTVFLPILSIKIDFVVTVPADGSTKAPVYIHTKLLNKQRKVTRTNRNRSFQQTSFENNEEQIDQYDDDVEE